jgi:hypothetical protein
VYLALVYHLGRPGSEIELPGQPPHGLRSVAQELEQRLPEGRAELHLAPAQLARLLSAMKGCVTELRVYHMQPGRRSTVEGWTKAAETLFPQLPADPDEALAIAEDIMNLQRRIQIAIADGGVST